MTSLQTWLAKIEAGHPTDIDMGLTRISEVATRLRLDFNSDSTTDFKKSTVVTVAGTNGKGTSCRLIESCCLEAGLTAGVYSSPHILQFNERIRINNENVSDEDICLAFEAIESAKQSISLTYFEYATLAALWLFKRASLDVVILEVGLGGRLDATNIIDADVNVITSISLDHQDYLGNTLEEIAREKTGIVKANKRTVVAYEQRYDMAEQWLSQQHNKIMRLGREFSYSKDVNGYIGEIEYEGRQRRYRWSSSSIPSMNVMTAVAALYFLSEAMPSKPAQTLSDFLFLPQNVQRVIEQTSLPGRAQLVHEQPYILLDVAHNDASAELLRTTIGTYNYTQCHIVVGMLKDKNIEQTLQCLGQISAHWYCASLPGGRGEQHQRLSAAVPREHALTVAGFDSIANAISSAIKNAANTDMIVIVGSFVSVAQAMSFFQTHPLD